MRPPARGFGLIRVTGEPSVTRGSSTSIDTAGTVSIAAGTATGVITWKSDNVWNNDGDTACVSDGPGRLVSQRRG
ncbi:hypothetical protein [Methanosphaerula palustris]|uniref:Late competence protein n=1 Tax=Methanosphaerula palustris (strain ATCC BAA-1556 / DSM 19958 / E1-9c) TaxID=521011 RepID=B8GK75_METPE|nr:hypothetical protein [Methanosphaerula palustris]ACL17146.1 late competence protein [Methanosphaerula palustris E1-9c]